MKQTKLLLLLLLLFLQQNLVAQSLIKGSVSNIDQQPIDNATVSNLTSKANTSTDINGSFIIQASIGDILAFSKIGYAEKQYTVENINNEINIMLLSDDKELEEVVIVGYGTQKKSSLTASVASISASEAQKQITSNVASAFQGRAAGVEVIQQGGIAGADVNIIVRGAASFGTSEPLYVIDGIFSNSGLSTLNPTDIESIEILKDGSAASIYGSRAANGVVLITTKKGKSGKPIIEINSTFGSQAPTNIPKFLNSSEWRSFANLVADNSGMPRAPENENPTNPDIDTDWANEWLQYAPVYSLDANISGGGKNSTFSTSLGYLDQTGMTIYSEYERYTLRANHTYKKGIFSISENIGVTNRRRTPTTSFNVSLPTLPVYDRFGRFTSGGPEFYINPEDGRAQNKIAPIHYTDAYTNNLDVIGGINASLQFNDFFQYRLSVGGNYGTSHGYTHTPVYYSKYYEDGSPNIDYGNDRNSLSEGRGAEFSYTIDNILTFQKDYNDHYFDALLGTSWMREFNRNLSIASIEDLGATTVTGVSNVDGKISAGEQNTALLSFFTRLNYDYDDRYLLSVSLRRDESSKFHKDSRVGYFPSISVGWNIAREDFFQTNFISNLKVRAGYGELGANFLNPYNFDPIAFGPIPYVFGDTRFVNGRGAYLKSKSLKWETSKSTNIGLDASFFDNKFYLTAEYFIKKNIDLLATIDLNLSSGQVFEINTSREKPYVNTASVENKGFELTLGYRNRYANDLNLDMNFNVSTVKNQVLALGTNVQPITSGGYSGFFNDAPSITRPGDPIGSFYGYQIDGFTSDGDFLFHDLTGDGLVNANDKTILGNPIPDLSFGLNTVINYKKIDFTLFIQGVYGNEIFNARKYTDYFDYSSNAPVEVLEAWSPSNKNTHIPIMKVGNTNGGNALPSEFYIEDGSYLRIKNLQVGYTFSDKILSKFKISNLRLFGSVQNLLTITNYSGYDPEVSSNALFSRGVDYNAFPNARIYNIGLNVKF